MQITILSFTEYVAVTKDIALTLAALVAAYVGIKGLNTWQRQLRGNTEYALAKGVLTALYELREAIAAVRNPFMQHSTEPDLPAEKLKELDPQQKQWHSLVQAYQTRWEPVAVAKSKFNSHLLEVEAVWGRDLLTKTEGLSHLVAELFWAIEDHIEARNPNGEYEKAVPDEIKKRREIMFERGAKHNDEYKKQLEKVISEIEAALKPHVLHYHR